ncbi:MAG: PAS domain-containing protein [Gammaproteobacteria bacterium]|nr:PAS domain-containing protein [Gammaproteobacteria bacterium]
MPTIQSLVSAQSIISPDSEFSDYSRDQLKMELVALHQRVSLADATEHAAQIGHYEWNSGVDRLQSCSEEYARLFNMTVDEVLQAQDSWDKMIAMVHPDDRLRYAAASQSMEDTGVLDFQYRFSLEDGTTRHVREYAVTVTDEQGEETGAFGLLQDVSDQVRSERDLEYRDELARQSEKITDIGHFIFDEVSETYVYVSEGFCRIHGSSVEDYLASVNSFEDDLADIINEDRARVSEAYLKHIDKGEGYAIEYRIRRADGAIRWLRELSRAKLMEDGRVSQTLGVIQDITDRVAREQELVFKDAMASQAEAITHIGYFLYDVTTDDHLYMSPGYARIAGLGVDQLRSKIRSGADYVKCIYEQDRERARKLYNSCRDDRDEWAIEYRLRRPDGELRWVREVGKVHLISHGIPEQTIGVLQDITEAKNAEQEIVRARDTLEQQVVERTRELANTVKQLEIEIEEREKITAELHFLANHDALTGLPSLRLCKDRLDRSLAEARRNRQTSAVMFLDLDGFKDINDRCGHEFGDRVLKATAERITCEIRETDTVARIGGDEFVIIISSLPESQITNRIATSLIEGISQPILIDQTEVLGQRQYRYFTVSEEWCHR